MSNTADIELAKFRIKTKISDLEKSNTELNKLKRMIDNGSENCREKDLAIEKVESTISQVEYLIDRYEDDLNYISQREETIKWI